MTTSEPNDQPKPGAGEVHIQILGPPGDDEWAVRCDRCSGHMWLDVGLTRDEALGLARDHAASTRHNRA